MQTSNPGVVGPVAEGVAVLVQLPPEPFDVCALSSAASTKLKKLLTVDVAEESVNLSHVPYRQSKLKKKTRAPAKQH